MIDFLKAMADPSKLFSKPSEILVCADLSKQQKIDILKQWEYDARELEVADEENMSGRDPDLLRDVLLALGKLRIHADVEHAPPTKQGGCV